MARSDALRFASVVAALVLVAGCNALLGLSDYSLCTDDDSCDAGAFDAEADAFVDAGADADTPPPIDASGTAPVRWARFKMPNYEQHYPNDGGKLENVSEPYAKGDGTIFDEVSTLTWRVMQEDERTARRYEEAKRTCDELPGPAKWRLPSRIELVTLIDLTVTPKMYAAFGGTSERYWSSSEVRPRGGDPKRWVVDFADGHVGHLAEASGRAAVQCILDQGAP